jgi:hypothetical protein
LEKCKSLVSTSTTEAKFVSWFEATSHVIWLRSFISGLEVVDTISKVLRIYCDNLNVVFFVKNNKSESRSKHIYIKYLAIRKLVKANKVVVEYIITELMIVDSLTKSLSFVAYKRHVAYRTHFYHVVFLYNWYPLH